MNMQPNPELVQVLERLVVGEIAADDWISWWQTNACWVEGLLNRGQFLRLKPRQPGAHGALMSQAAASELLTAWGIERTCSPKYRLECDKLLKQFLEEAAAERSKHVQRYLPIIKRIEPEYPRFAKFLKKHVKIIEHLGEPVEQAEIEALEGRLHVQLPPSYRAFLLRCRSVELGDSVKFGFPYTFIHNSTTNIDLPTQGMLCFGDCWLDGDGDQVLFGKQPTECDGGESPVLYYSHESVGPKVRKMAVSFAAWIESIAKWSDFDV